MRLFAAAILSLLPLAATAAQPGRETRAPGPEPRAEAQSAAIPVRIAPACNRFSGREQARDGAVLRRPSARAQRLNELPPGDLHLTVERQLGGCRQPVIVRENIGGAAFVGR